MTPPLKRYPIALRILLMFSVFFFNISVVSFIAVGIAEKLFGIENFQEVTRLTSYTNAQLYALFLVQGIGALGGFALSAMMFAVLEAGEFKKHLGLSVKPSAKLVLLAVLSILTAQFFIEFLVTVNKQISLPPSLEFLYRVQQANEAASDAMLNFTHPLHLLAAIVVMAVIPAIAEEFFFRGLLLGDLLKEGVHPAIAIGVTGLVFSISHIHFDNTLAIWALGAFLGYLYYASGSLWLPILVHFINNLGAVMLQYLYHTGVISSDLAEAKTPLYITVISTGVFAALMFLFNKWKTAPGFIQEEEYEDELLNENPNA